MRLSLIRALVLCCSLVSGTVSVSADDKPAAKVGALLSLSGGLEQWCSYIQKGIELAEAEPTTTKLSVLLEDDRSLDRKSTINAATKLLQVDKVDLLYSWTASAIPILIPIATKARTPLLIGAHDHRVSEGGKYAFGAFVNYDLLPREIAQFLVGKKGARRLALVTAADDWSQGFDAPFRDEAKKLGAEVVVAETILPDQANTSALVVRLKAANVDAVLAPLYAGSLYSLLKEAHQLHFNGAIHVGDGMFEEDIKTAGITAEGVYASQIWLESDKLTAMYKARYGDTANPLQLGIVASGYDWVRHLQLAAEQIIQRGQKISREALTERLRSFHSTGFLGGQMYGAPPRESGEVMVVVRGGRYKRVH